MQLDVRIPIGWLFLTLGIILVIYGFTSDPAIYVQHSLGVNVNLRWGTVFAIFGAVVLFIAKRKKS
jgi:hypothetical protein